MIKKHAGLISILVIVFGSIFLMLLGGTLGFVELQHRQSRERVSFAQALETAEAGMNYYRWHLAHDPDDMQDGAGAPGPYVHNYDDPEGSMIGQFSLEITAETSCGVTSGVKITSTGWTVDHPEVKRTVSVRYVKPTVADYSFLLNDNVWVGADVVITGPYHSNGGIRMDGENNSLVTSAKETWTCTGSFGCNPAQTKPGIFGAGENSDLWRFPVPVFDFNLITVDLAQIKSSAQSAGGLYFAPSGAYGYHAILHEDRTIDVYRVDDIDTLLAYDLQIGWFQEPSVIDSETFIGSFNIPGACSAIFFEDDLWLSGENTPSKINGKVTIASADLINPNNTTDTWLNGNIEYVNQDGTDGFLLIAQHNNLIGPYVPNIMTLHGVYIAQTGHFARNHYPQALGQYQKRELLEMFGTVVSNGRVGTKWTSNGLWSSGFKNRQITYDPAMSLNPPPFLPSTSDVSEFREWEELED